MNLTIPLQIKSLHNREFEGHGSVFGNVDYGGDIVVKGAFKRTLAEHKMNGTLPMMFYMHDSSLIPGKYTEMYEDDTGLHVKGILADTQLGNETRTLLKMNAVSGMSIGYITTDSDYDKNGHKLIKEVDLIEVSIVSLPMNPAATVVHTKTRLSALGEYVPTQDEVNRKKRDLEQYLRHNGFSRNVSSKYASDIFKIETSETLESPDLTSETLEDEATAKLKQFGDTFIAEAVRQIRGYNHE